MKILFITHLKNDTEAVNDIINDSSLHGFREVYGDNVIDYPGAWYMYKDEVNKRSFNYSDLWGNGFTYYDSFNEYNKIDRSDIKNKIINNYFEYIIYGSYSRSSHFFDEAIKSKSKIILIDGEDNTDLKFNKNKNIIFFKRELLEKKENIFPINVTIPKAKIVDKINESPENLLAPLIPHRYKTYIYKNESDYYKMWQNSLFGISYVYGGWWEAVRYYEMLMNGCIPLILNLNKCPKDTLTKLPKAKLSETFDNYSWILNKYFPLSIYKKKFLNLDKFVLYFKYLFKKKYNSKSFIEEYPEINILRKDLLNHTKNHLTTENNAKYIIQKANEFYLKK